MTKNKPLEDPELRARTKKMNTINRTRTKQPPMEYLSTANPKLTKVTPTEEKPMGVNTIEVTQMRDRTKMDNKMTKTEMTEKKKVKRKSQSTTRRPLLRRAKLNLRKKLFFITTN
jgi:hypothetical protein